MCWETAYEQWLNAPALSQQEQEELRAIQKDKMELRERFCAPLAFGTAGLRGTMKVGLLASKRTSDAQPSPPSIGTSMPRVRACLWIMMKS